MSNPFGELISRSEGSYNSYNRGTKKDEHGNYQIIPADRAIDFSQMTIAEIQRRQKLTDDPDKIFAVGKYQFVPDTLNDGLLKLGIDSTDKFTPELQDRLFVEYELPAKRPAISAYIRGEPGATLHAAQIAASREWASIEDPDAPGHAYFRYEARGNKMQTTCAQVATALDEMRVEYKAQIDKGLSPEEAWRATANMGPGSFERTTDEQRPRSHASDPAVQALQERLNALGYTDAEGRELVADGRNGRHTREAVEAFQRDNGLHVDGVAGPVTLAAVSETLAISSIGQPDAPYLRNAQTPDLLAGYRGFSSPAVPGLTENPFAVGPSAAAESPSVPVTFRVVAPMLDTPAILGLQEQLNTLGFTDHHGHPVPVSGIYDAPTRFAVMGFQHDHDLLATGQPDSATVTLIRAHARIAELQQIQSEERSLDPRAAISMVSDMSPSPSAPAVGAWQASTFRPFSDPAHPQHGVYAELEKLLPAGTSPERLTQATAACHKAGIDKPQDLAGIIGSGSTILFTSRAALGCQIGEMDISQPAPSIQQTLQQMQQFDQQRDQHRAQSQVQIDMQSQQGPQLGER